MVLTSCDACPHQPWAAPRHCCTAQAQARLAEPWSPEPSPRGPWGLSPCTQSTLRAGAGVRKETGGKEGRIWMNEGITLLVQLQSYKGSRCSCSVPQSFLILCDPVGCSMPGFPVHHHLPSLLKLMSIESVMPSNHLVLCRPLLLPSIFLSISLF